MENFNGLVEVHQTNHFFKKFIIENIIFQRENVIDFDYKSVLVNNKM